MSASTDLQESVTPSAASRAFLVTVAMVLSLFVARPALALITGEEAARFQDQREIFLELRQRADADDWRGVRRLQGKLEDYPLASYAEYERLMGSARSVSGDEAREFVDAHSDSPLGVRYLGHYLSAAGVDRRWGDYLVAAAHEPRSERLRCYYARAKRGRGAKDEAWTLADQLFLSGSSVHTACDPLFKLWRQAGQLDDELVWQRAKLAFEARQGGLLRYVASLGSKGSQPQLKALRQSYQYPHRTLEYARELPSQSRSDVTLLGLERLSRYDPAQALYRYQKLPESLLDASQRQRLDRAIAFRALLERDDNTRAWLDRQLPLWSDDQLTEMRLRWAIAEQDWPSIERTTAALSATKQSADVWLYWSARARAEQGAADEAQALYAKAAAQRSYYGFLSADLMGLPYSYGMPGADQTASQAALKPMRPALLRVHELFAIDEDRLAQAEWDYLVARSDRGTQRALAKLASEQHWYRLSIDAANASRSWSDIQWRFPLAYVEQFRRPAMTYDLPLAEIMAIARRESAFFPAARSPVGARGLMQLMPATGRAVAKSQGRSITISRLYDVEENIDLGSAYYRQLLDRFDGNRAVALAAYNAGPNRVKHWLGNELPLDAWIETIPYRETRDYVKAVLAYSVVFDHRLGQDTQLMSVAEQRNRF
ncbi:MAG: transglycosylase SLT domain-containing protein [Pseudomonadota bacterium]